MDRNPFVLGRLQECDLTLRDRRISRRHAQILRIDGIHFVEDLGSRHGVKVNGRRVRRRRLEIGDRIEFGIGRSFCLTVCEGANPKAALLKKFTGLSATRSRTGALGRLSAMLEVARTMESSDGVEDVFDAVVEAALTIARAERAFLLLRDESGELGVKAACAASGTKTRPPELDVPRSTIARALDARKEVFSVTLGLPAEVGYDGTIDSPSRASRQNALCVPILRMRIGQDHETSVVSARSDTLGALYMDAKGPGIRLPEGNQALLQALAIEISTVVENARLIEQEREKRRLEHELETARAIQQALLPPALPDRGWITAKGHCQAQAQVGGDYYDLMQVGSGQWAAVVADVSGKGLAASLLASLLQGAFFLGSGARVSLSGTLGRTNRYICERSVHARFATVFALIVGEDGTLRWSNAGHCPAILVRAAGGLEWLGPNSRPLGLFDDEEFAEDVCRLHEGDKLVIYTDGITELRNVDGEQFGEGRLGRTVAEHAGLGASELFDALLARFRQFSGAASRSDDLTLLTIGYKGSLPDCEQPPRDLQA